METVNENLVPVKGVLDPTVHSRKVFIDYIARFLAGHEGLKNEYDFIAGKDIRVQTKSTGLLKTAVTISAIQSKPPTDITTQFIAEYGRDFPAESQSITIRIKRESYPLVKVDIPNVYPEIHLNAQELSRYTEGEEIVLNVVNGAYVDGDSLVMAGGGSYADYMGNKGSIVSGISRRTRHFWGSQDSPSAGDIFLEEGIRSVLGNLPSALTVDHGVWPSRFVIATDKNIEVLAQGMTVGFTVTEMEISPYADRPAYKKNYKIYVSTGTSTGKYTYQIKTL